MADIRITPASSVMSFTSSLNFTETLTQDASGSLNLYGSGSTGRTEILSIDGNNGRLFTVSDDLSDSLFSVNTIAGLPVIEAFADNSVNIGQYTAPPIKVTGSQAIITGSLFGTVTNTTNIAITDTSTNATYYPVFVSATSGNTVARVDSSTLTYNPNSNTLTTTQFAANSLQLGGLHTIYNYLSTLIIQATTGATIELGGGPGFVQNNVNVKNGTLAVGTTSPQGRLHVYQPTNLGGTAGNSLILQTLQNTGGAGGNVVFIKDYAVRDATGTDWTTWRHHNSIDIDGVYNTPGTNTRCFWERDPLAGIHYFGNSATIALTVNGATNTIIANNIEVEANTTGIYNDSGDLAVGDWNGNNYGTTFYGQGGNNLINLSTNVTQFYYPIQYTLPPGTSEVNGEVANWGDGSVAAGNLYYYNSSGNWALVDADAASTATGMLGIARATGTASTVGMLLRGRARYTSNSNYTALSTIGAPLYISTTPGGFTQTAPTGTGDIVRIIGYVLSTASDEIYFCPDNVWVEVI